MDYVTNWVHQLDCLLADETNAVVLIPRPDENAGMLEKLFANWSRSDGAHNLFLGVDLSNEESLLRSLGQAVINAHAALDSCGPWVARTKADEIVDLSSLDASMRSVDALARRAAPIFARVVIIGTMSNIESLGTIERAIASSASARWVLLHDERLSTGTPQPIQRRGPALLDVRDLVAAVTSGRGGRVWLSGMADDQVRRWLDTELRGADVDVTFVHAPTADRGHIGLSALSALDALHRPGDPIRNTALVLEERAEARPQLLVVCIEWSPGGATDLRSFVHGIAANVVSSRVSILVSSPMLGSSAPRALLGTRALLDTSIHWTRHPFRFDSNVAVDYIERRVEDPGAQPRERAGWLISLAFHAASQRATEKALEYATSALRIAMELADDGLVSLAFYAIGNAGYRAERSDLALTAFVRSTSLALESGSDAMAARGFLAMGSSYFIGRSYDEALRCYAGAIAIAERLGDEALTTQAAIWFGEALAKQGRVGDAAAMLESAATRQSASLPEVAQLFGPLKGEAHARLAHILTDARLFDRAKAHLAAAEKHGPHCGNACPPPT